MSTADDSRHMYEESREGTVEAADVVDARLSPEPVPETAIEVKYASLLKRAVANLIDGIILAILGAFIDGMSRVVDFRVGQISLSFLAFLALVAYYYIRGYATTGQTVGKRLRDVRVISVDGEPLSWQQGLLRYLGYFVSALPLGLGYLWAIGDKRKQAWHDKIAGTIVVDDQVPLPAPLLTGEEMRRQRRRWLVALCGFDVVVVAALAFVFIGQSVDEVEAMQPWPAADEQPAAVVPPDLSLLGLTTAEIANARGSNTLWGEGRYERGVVGQYGSDGQAAVWIAALRHDTREDARASFAEMVAWAQGSCGQYRYGRMGATGLIECGLADAYDKTFLNGNWIIDVIVLDTAPAPPDQFVDQVRDAIVKHWQTLAGGSHARVLQALAEAG